jgi:UDP-N-acetylmuramoyl-L-alanyl-D-glutamate--2,6-diaminopimelate ligase
VRGFHSDGHQFISQALDRGAVAVVAEHEGTDTASADAMVLVEDTRKALALLADAFYGHPSRRLKLIGVTGTNGKTTTTYLVKSIIEAAGSAAGLIGTIDYRVGGRVYPAPNTTPDALDLQRLLAEMVGLGASFCVMEASSHALELGRTVGCDFAAAAFTNLTQDHLDFHKTMDSYFHAKLQLFMELSPDAVAVVNADDARAAEIVGATRARVITTGMTQAANVRPSGTILNGLSFTAVTPAGTVTVESSLVGRHNIYNILTAIGLGIAMGFETGVIAAGIANMKAVPGRMEKVNAGQPFGVIVDYAHTEDALVRLLEAAREITEGRIITVFGCGGDRDRTKRPKMGAVAAIGSDVVIVTSDNPRTEDSHAIIGEIEAGMAANAVRVPLPVVGDPRADGMTPYVVVPDRRLAIAEAVSMAKPDDIVVLAGKGHEDYQIIGEKKIHFDDREVAREEIRKILADRGLRIAE